jgi:ABC-type transport system involved in multi-copper enzyme maturation permease subunit
MRAQLRSELFKQQSTLTSVGLLATMLGLVLLAVLLHGFALATDDVDSSSQQLTNVFGWGELLGAVFAALLGAVSMTSEVRHGTIRPTFLVTPRRSRVLAAKSVASLLIGLVFGLAAAAVAAAAGSVALAARGLETRLEAGDFALLLAGGAAAAALWAVIGVGVGAIVRNQVATTVGVVVWLLFVENQLVANVPGLGRFAPGALGQALSGQDPDTLLAPALGALLLIVYATVAALAGSFATARRDVV